MTLMKKEKEHFENFILSSGAMAFHNMNKPNCDRTEPQNSLAEEPTVWTLLRWHKQPDQGLHCLLRQVVQLSKLYFDWFVGSETVLSSWTVISVIYSYKHNEV